MKGEILFRRCGAKALADEATFDFLQRPCGGCAAGRAAAQVTENKNYLWSKYAISWKEVQCKGAMLIAVVPIPPSLVDYKRLDEVAQVQADGYGSRVLPPADSDQGGIDNTVVQRAGTDSEDQGEGEEEEGSLRVANTYGRTEMGEQEPMDLEGVWSRPWLQAPEWMPRHLLQPSEQRPQEGGQRAEVAGDVTLEASNDQQGRAHNKGAHNLAFAGPLVYCVKCANFAHRRVGSGLKGICAEPTYKKANAVAARLQRLRSGRHPLTGRPLTL